MSAACSDENDVNIVHWYSELYVGTRSLVVGRADARLYFMCCWLLAIFDFVEVFLGFCICIVSLFVFIMLVTYLLLSRVFNE